MKETEPKHLNFWVRVHRHITRVNNNRTYFTASFINKGWGTFWMINRLFQRTIWNAIQIKNNHSHLKITRQLIIILWRKEIAWRQMNLWTLDETILMDHKQCDQDRVKCRIKTLITKAILLIINLMQLQDSDNKDLERWVNLGEEQDVATDHTIAEISLIEKMK